MAVEETKPHSFGSARFATQKEKDLTKQLVNCAKTLREFSPDDAKPFLIS